MPQSVLIRFAMLTGVLLFGGVIWFNQRTTPAAGVGPDGNVSLLWVARVTWAVAVIGCLAILAVSRRDRTGTRSARLSIIAWALGEAVALNGAVVWNLTGTPAWYIPGVVFLLLTFLIFPGQRA